MFIERINPQDNKCLEYVVELDENLYGLTRVTSPIVRPDDLSFNDVAIVKYFESIIQNIKDALAKKQNS